MDDVGPSQRGLEVPIAVARTIRERAPDATRWQAVAQRADALEAHRDRVRLELVAGGYEGADIEAIPSNAHGRRSQGFTWWPRNSTTLGRGRASRGCGESFMRRDYRRIANVLCSARGCRARHKTRLRDRARGLHPAREPCKPNASWQAFRSHRLFADAWSRFRFRCGSVTIVFASRRCGWHSCGACG